MDRHLVQFQDLEYPYMGKAPRCPRTKDHRYLGGFLRREDSFARSAGDRSEGKKDKNNNESD